MKLWARISAYFDHPDPHVAIAGTVALIVVGNQPFYPFYVWYAVGHLVAPAFLTWLSAPVFALAPRLARAAPDRGRALLLFAALGNTCLSAKALGTASGVEAFYLPCLALAAISFAPGRRIRPVLLTSAAIAVGLMVDRIDGPALAGLDTAQAHSLATMHAVSVACLLVVLAWSAYRAAQPASA